jgi:hypothetical protein
MGIIVGITTGQTTATVTVARPTGHPLVPIRLGKATR